MSNTRNRGLLERAVNWDTTSGAALSVSTAVNIPTADGPYAVLALSVAHGQNSQTINARPVAFPGKFRLLSRKYKPELDATVELWGGWNIMGNAVAGSTSFAFDYDSTADGAAIGVVALTGAAQGDEWVSTPVWRYTTSNERLQFETPDLPSKVNAALAEPSNIGQYVFEITESIDQFFRANGATSFTFNFNGTLGTPVYNGFVVANGLVDIGGLGLAPAYIETSASAAAALGVSVNIYSPHYFDAKEGYGLDDDAQYDPDDDPMLKERIAQLEAEAADFGTTRSMLEKAVDDLTTDRNKIAARLTKLERSTSKQAADHAAALAAAKAETAKAFDSVPALVEQTKEAYFREHLNNFTLELGMLQNMVETLQTELEDTRADLSEAQVQLAVLNRDLPILIEQGAEERYAQRLAELIADPAAFRNVVLAHAQSASTPASLFGALQSLRSFEDG